MRRVWLAMVVVGCSGPAVVTTGSGELAVPEALSFPPTALSFSRVQPLLVLNRARAPRTVEVSVDGPFAAVQSLDVPGGAEVTLEVHFAPTAAGPATGTLRLDGREVALSGEGVPALDCGAGSVCESVAFDPETLRCVRTPRPDGTACEDELACIEGGTCQAGACLGRAARCDDGNACTTDACSVGRGCQHTTMACAAPTNPCLAPRCDPVLGCSAAPVQDGTPCGAVSCELANVCLLGACRAVVPPEGFTCSPESACRGEGVCRNKVCERPAERELLPRWTVTASSSDFRFDGVSDAQGNWYWVECASQAVRMGTPDVPARPGHRCEVHSRTPEGLERFRAEVTGVGSLRGTYADTQLIAQGLFIFAVNDATLAAVNVTTGVVQWHQPIRSSTSGYQGIEALAEDGRGGLWVIVRSDAESSSWALARVDVATGRVLATSDRPSRVRGLVVDGSGRAFVLRDDASKPLPARSYLIERHELDGSVGFSVPTPSRHAPVMVLGDALVMADDEVRSALDGRQLEPRSGSEWSTFEWVGVGQAGASSRLRLARLTALPEAPPTSAPRVGLQRVDASGARSQVFTAVADRASEAYLTAAGEALFVTSGSRPTRPGGPALETRVRSVHPLGLELMSCALNDESFSGTPGVQPVLLGGKSAFNGRFLAVQSVPLDVNCFDCDIWAPLRLAFFDLGRPGPGVAATGWTGPRGTPGGSARPR